ncbi:hypothetical protein ACKWTF_007881 [Chironomus riparius]
MNFVQQFLILATLLTGLIAIAYKLIFDYEYIPNLVSIDVIKDRYYDFIIIGSGTSGSVLAYELSKHSNYTVLLIEAGGIFNGLSIIPILSTMMQGTEMDWQLKSAPQLYSSRGLKNEQQCLSRGKGVGGSNQLNYLLHFSGIPGDFDEWRKAGAVNWSYDNLKCYLHRHEMNDNGKCENDSDSPKLSIVEMENESPLTRAFTKAKKKLKANFNPNVTLNLSKFTTRKGVRHTVFHEYLRRAYKHKNLSIVVHARVEKIEFNENKEAISVKIVTQSQVTRVNVRKEVILAAGTFHSPHILKRSGIGDKNELKKFGIDLIHDSQAVGENLFDHMNFPLFVSITESATVTKDKILSAREIYRYLVDGAGILSTTAVIGSGRLNDYGLILFGTGSADEKTLKHVANFKTDVFRAFFPLYANSSQEGFIALSTCYMPKSRGRIMLNPKTFGNDFLIDPQYLKEDYDIECMINAIRLNIRLIKSDAFQAIGATIHFPKLRQCQNFGPFDEPNFEPSDRYLECLLRHAALTAHHPGGTCAIGSVVDNDLNVIGVKKLRVIDGSVFPLPLSGYPNSAIVAVAERASKLILNGELKNN